MIVQLAITNDDGTVTVFRATKTGNSLGGPGPDMRALFIKYLHGVPLDERETEEVEYLRTQVAPCQIWPHAAHDACPGVFV